MKLICCDIEGFGTLQKAHMDFQEGLHVVIAPNGAGKTTLAVFIKAMLFGLGRGSRGSLSKNDRKKYRPWQGGAYGGSLTLELGEKHYRITRFFGETPSQDSFRLVDLDSGKPSTDYSADFGREVFRLDEGAFCRSTYVPQRQEGNAPSAEQLHRRLTELIQDTDAQNNYDAAMKRLQTRRIRYRHHRGEGGSISTIRGKLHQTMIELEKVRDSIAAESALSEEIRGLTAHRQDLSGQLSALRGELGRLEALGCTQAVRALERAYPKGFPEGLDSALVAQRQQTRLSARLDLTALREEDAGQLDRLSALFEGGATDLEAARAQAEAIAALESAPRPRRVGSWILTILALPVLGMGAYLLLAAASRYGWLALGIGVMLLLLGLIGLLRPNRRASELASRRRQLAKLLSPFGANTTLEQAEQLSERYNRLSRQHDAQLALEDTIRKLEQTVASFCRDCCPHGDLEQMALDRERYRSLVAQSLNGAGMETLRLREDALTQALERTEETLLSKRQLRLELVRQIESIPSLEQALGQLRKELEQQERNCALLDATMELLTKARENLSRNYLAPVEERFSRYVAQLGLPTGRIRLEGDLMPTLEWEGEQRESAWFSAGQEDLLNLAMHLALTDVLFPAEQPFLVLDDPLVNLDEVHTAKAMELLRCMGEQRQVLYLTCHIARA